jgi:hypothetical protein
VPAHIRPLLGPGWLLEGEDPELFEELLAQVAAAIQPRDISDWILVKDFVALTWEIHRSRRVRERMLRLGRREGMERILAQLMEAEDSSYRGFDEGQAGRLAADWFSGCRRAVKRVDAMLARANLSLEDVDVQALAALAVDLDRIDAQNDRHEDRRDRLLRQIEARRAGWAGEVARASEEVVEAEFRDTSPALDGAAGDPRGEAAE